tara:strand:+ start:1026 stop:2663 length:1638 start_codon:yes stop_codon:yes gene_type:complete
MANFDLNKLMEGKNPQAVMLEETRGLKNKWEKTGLLEGLKERDQHQMSVLLENQAKQLLDEANATSTSSGNEEWNGVALPLVRRIFGEIAAKNFVSVQPMNLPSGLIFYLDFKYNNNQFGSGSAVAPYSGSSLFGGDGSDLGSTNVAKNGLYGSGRYGYTLNDQNVAVTAGNTTVATASMSDINYDANFTASVAANKVFKITIAKSNISSTADDDAIKAFTIVDAGDGDELGETIGEHNRVEGSNYVFFVSGAADANIDAVDVNFANVPASTNRGDFEDRDPVNNAGGSAGSGTVLDIPEIDLELKSEAIVAKTRKLKAVWTPELAQDLNAYHSIDAEAELTSMLSEYISLEIDLEILDMIRQGALTNEKWSAKVGSEWDGSAFQMSAFTGQAYTKNTWFSTLGTKINKVSNKIHQLTLRGGANFIVASPDVCTILESIPQFTVNAGKDAQEFAAGVSAIGALSSRYTVYKNPYMTSNQILLGYKGNNFLESGAVYAPYVPLIMTPLVYDPSNFTPRRGVMTRYAKKLVRPEFYGTIDIADLDLV